MKSKTFCFNTTIFKKNLSHYWPIWILFFGYLLMVLPVNLWLHATTSERYESLTQQSKQYMFMSDVLGDAIRPIPLFAIAAIAAIAVFSYLYTAKNANMIHSLPVNRKELYITNYVSGLSFLIIPELIAFVTAVLVCLANQITCIEYLFVWLIYMAGMTFFAFSLATFVCMFTGLLVAMPVYYVIVNYLYVGCSYLVSRIIILLCYGIAESWNPGVSCILSPMYYANNNIRVKSVYADGSEQISGVSILGGKLVLIYAIAAVFIMLAAYQLYKRRRIETAGDLISIGIVKPIFRWGVALCGGTMVAVFITGMLKNSHKINVYGWLVFSLIIFGVIGFFVAEMLIQKNFRVFRKDKILECVGFAVIAFGMITLFKLDVLGIEQRIPAAEEIEKAFVYMDYPIEIQEENYEELLRMHEQVIKSKESYLSNFNAGGKYYYTTFRYYLKDGTMFERCYPMSLTEESLNSEMSPAFWILAMERQPEQLETQILGKMSNKNEYYSVYIDRYDEEGKSDTYVFSKDEIPILIDAIRKDIAEGNFDDYQIYSLKQDDVVSYVNGISCSYYNNESTYGNWEYYYNYADYRDSDREMAVTMESSGSSYISFGSECTNTIQALEDIGAIDDTWRLYNYSEYERITNNK